MPEETQVKKITMSFRKSADYKLYPAGNAYIAPTIDGTKLLVNFTIDHPSLPSYQTYPINEKGIIDMNTVIDSTSAGELEKEILCGILLTTQDAKSIGQFLVNWADKLMGKQ